MPDKLATNANSALAPIDRAEFELACIREFSHSGHHFGVGVSRIERVARIRAAILREQKSDQRWHDSQWTYAGAFMHAFQQPLDTADRRAPEPWSASLPADIDEDLQESHEIQNLEEELGEGGW